MLADIMVMHWFDMIPKSIPNGDNRENKYTSSATLSINALQSRQYENILPHVLALYKKLPAYSSNATIANSDVLSLSIECCRTFFPSYIFEMMVDNPEGMRTFLNSVMAGSFSHSLALIKEYSKSDIMLILKNDAQFRKYTHNNIYETILQYRNTVYDRAIQSDVGRVETPAMLKDEIVRLKTRINKVELTLKHKVVECNTLSAQLAAARTELSAASHDINLSNQLNTVLSRLDNMPQPADDFTAKLELHMNEHDMRITKLSMDILGIFDHTEKANNNIRETIELKLTSFKSILSSLSGKIATITNLLGDLTEKVNKPVAYTPDSAMLLAYDADSTVDHMMTDLPRIAGGCPTDMDFADIYSDTASVMSIVAEEAEPHVVNAAAVAAATTDKRKRPRKAKS
jgi:hypothetical protein